MGLAERLGVTFEPETVEKASRWERWRRQTWLITSTAVTMAAALVPFYALGIIPYEGALYGKAAIAISWLALWMWLDAKLFAWGINHFDLVIPWQFREASGE